MTAVATAIAVAGGLYLYYKVLDKPKTEFRGGRQA